MHREVIVTLTLVASQQSHGCIYVPVDNNKFAEESCSVEIVFNHCFYEFCCFLQWYYLFFKCSLSVLHLCQSPLVQAIFSRNAEEVTFLLNHEDDVNSLVILVHFNSAIRMCFANCCIKFELIIFCVTCKAVYWACTKSSAVYLCFVTCKAFIYM